MPILKRIHVNQHNIRHNAKHPEDPRPVLTVKSSRGNKKGNSVEIHGPSEVVYSPDKPLNCGAKVWISTKSAVTIK